MAKPPQFKWQKDFMLNLRTSPMAFAELKRRGAKVAAAAGPGHRVTAMVTRGGKNARARVQVTADSEAARRAAFANNNLLKALGRGRE